MTRKPYPTDLTDAQWDRLQPLLPPPKSGTPRGGRPATDTREVVNAILHVLRAGGSWRLRPHDFPAWQTVHTRFRLWRLAGVWDRAHDALRREVRVEAGVPPTPETLRADSQTVKTTRRGGPKGYDGGKKGGRPQAGGRGRLARAGLGPPRDPGVRPGPGRRPVAARGRPALAAPGPGGGGR